MNRMLPDVVFEAVLRFWPGELSHRQIGYIPFGRTVGGQNVRYGQHTEQAPLRQYPTHNDNGILAILSYYILFS